jgi:two-component system, NarL family, nitrate/nitrite response regulator NarL
MGQSWALLIESRQSLRQKLRELLAGTSRTAVAEAATALDGVRQAICLRPDLVILDTSTLDGDGPALGQLIHELLPQCQVILLVDDPGSDGRPAADHDFAATIAMGAIADELPRVLSRMAGGQVSTGPPPRTVLR